MAEFYIGQIMLTGFGFAPRGFAQCNGQTMSISQNQALFSLIGTTYGGNGSTTFLLPNMQGTTPVGAGASVDPSWQPPPYTMGAFTGVENVTLLAANMPQHTHTVNGNTQAGSLKDPRNAVYAGAPSEALYGPGSGNPIGLNPAQISPSGGNQPHNNMQPYRVINFNIALTGIFPSRG